MGGEKAQNKNKKQLVRSKRTCGRVVKAKGRGMGENLGLLNNTERRTMDLSPTEPVIVFKTTYQESQKTEGKLKKRRESERMGEGREKVRESKTARLDF